MAKRLGQVLGCVAGDRQTSTGTRRARSARPSKPSYEASPHFTGSHSSVNTTSTKRRVVGNKFTVEPISQITYLLTGATWIFAVILMIPPQKGFLLNLRNKLAMGSYVTAQGKRKMFTK